MANKIDFTDVTNVKFYVKQEGATCYTQVLSTTTFSLAGYTAGLQPYISASKASGTTTGAVTVDFIRIISER